MDAPPFCENKSLYRVICLEHIKKEQAIREAVFSAQMEGLRVTAETERRIRKILDGGINRGGARPTAQVQRPQTDLLKQIFSDTIHKR